MDNLEFNYHSFRAQKARVGHALAGMWMRVLTIVAVVLIISGVALLVINQPAGWLLLGFAAIPAMFIEWYTNELRHIPSPKSPKTIDDVLSSDILGQLSKKPTPRDIATAAGRVQSGYFFYARFGISARALQEMSSDDASATSAVWKEAQLIREQLNLEHITGSILVVALIRQFP